jgi:hypothetical protein
MAFMVIVVIIGIVVIMGIVVTYFGYFNEINERINV